jgi:NADPH-dependent 2,4-dienoyl-CoA reductase/sulfur reductase-like enzyme
MIRETFTSRRDTRHYALEADLVIIGGGVAGACAAITAARAGIKVILAGDRPVLGGNASSEVRLWILGASSHMGNNNRWAREGGVIDEILVENMYRNPEGNAVVFDSVLLDKVASEPNITLLLNTSIYEVEKRGDDMIAAVTGFCSQNATTYTLSAPLFMDSSGDGIVGFLSGAAFRMGAEGKEDLEGGFRGRVCFRPGVWRAAGSFPLFLYEGYGEACHVRGAVVCVEGYQAGDTAVPEFQGG